MTALLPDLSSVGSEHDRGAQFDRWQTAMPLDSYRQHDSSDALRVHMGLNHVAPTDGYLRKVNLFLGYQGLGPAEFAGVSTTPRALADEALRRAAKLGQYIYRTARTTEGPPVPTARLGRLLPKALQTLPETMLDPDHGDDYGEIDQRHGGRLATFMPIVMRKTAIAVYVMEHSYRPTSNMAPFLSGLERVGDIFVATGEDFRHPSGVERALMAYLTGRLFPADGPVARKEVIRIFLSLDRLFAAFVLDHPELADALGELRPARLPAGSRLADDFRNYLVKVATDCDANRKKTSNPLADEFDRRHANVHVRAVESWTMDWHCRRAEKVLLERRPDGGYAVADDSLGFSYRSRAVRQDGRRTTSMQRTYMVAHRRRSLFPERTADDVVFQFVRVEAENGLAHEQWYVPTFRDGVLLPPNLLSVERREVRRETIIRLELPEFARRPSGVAGFSGRADVEDAADALSRGVVLIPIREFAHAMLLTHLMFRVMAYTFCRVGELLQMVYPPTGWKSIEVLGKRWHAFAAIPKGWTEEDWLIVDKRTLKFIKMLAKLTLLREAGGRLVSARPTTALKGKAEPAKFVFSFGGHHFQSDELNFMFQHLTAGLGRFRSHDIRRAAAKRAKNEDVEEVMVARLLRMKGTGLSKAPLYFAPTEKDRNEGSAAFAKRRDDAELIGEHALSPAA